MVGLMATAVIMVILPYTLSQYANSINLNQTDTEINNIHSETQLNKTSPILSSEVRVLGTNDDDIIILNNVIYPLPTTVEAKEGNDVIRGSTASDLIYGGGGNDSIQGDPTNLILSDDVINGDDGDDALSGMRGSDSLNGGNGDDNLFGDEDNDILSGGSGEDRLVGGYDSDILRGGPDKDVFDCGTGGAGEQDIVQDFQQGIDEQPDNQCEIIKTAN